MHDDPIIDLISSQSMRRLNEMERDLEQLLQRATFELEMVRRAKSLKGAKRGNGAPSVRAPEGARHGNGRGSKRGPIKRVLESEPNRTWRPREVSRALAEQGITLSRDGSRVTMNRMVDDNELEKLADGYRIARNGAASHTVSPAVDATTNGENREMRLTAGSPLGAG
jgi:hypothetical protein